MATIKQVTERVLTTKVALLSVKKLQATQCDTAVANLERAYREEGDALAAESTKAAGWERAYDKERNRRKGFWAITKRVLLNAAVATLAFTVGHTLK